MAWKLCTTMKAEDVTDTLELALQASGLDQVNVAHRPRLLSDNGPSYVSASTVDGRTGISGGRVGAGAGRLFAFVRGRFEYTSAAFSL